MGNHDLKISVETHNVFPLTLFLTHKCNQISLLFSSSLPIQIAAFITLVIQFVALAEQKHIMKNDEDQIGNNLYSFIFILGIVVCFFKLIADFLVIYGAVNVSYTTFRLEWTEWILWFIRVRNPNWIVYFCEIIRLIYLNLFICIFFFFLSFSLSPSYDWNLTSVTPSDSHSKQQEKFPFG